MSKDPAAGILTLEEAKRWRARLRREGKRLVVTNGCFDLLHRGHAEYLYESRKFGDALLILVNSDASVRKLKGSARPLVDAYSRCYLLSSLACVDATVVFDGERCDRELRELSADLYVKGGDYTLDTLDPLERAALEEVGTEIRFKPFLSGFSSSRIIEKIRKSQQGSSRT